MTDCIVICHTLGCENKGIPIVVTVGDDDPEVPAPSVFLCTPCGQPITDIQDA
jgi:hypothetical protein